jgi:sterol 3beta-glucosyltransferase
VIIEVDKSSAMDFSETIEVKVFDKDEQFSMDSYFFAYFHDLPVALDQIRDAVRTYRTSPHAAAAEILDTTHTRASSTPGQPSTERARTLSSPNVISKLSQIGGGFSFTSLLRPFHDTTSQSENTESPKDGGKIVTRSDEDFMHISKRASFVPFTSSPRPITPPPTTEAEHKTSEKNQVPASSPPATLEHTYPPSSLPQDVVSVSSSEGISTGYWNVGVPLWLRGSTKKIFNMPFGGSNHESSRPGMSSVYCSVPSSRSSNQNDLGYSVLETPETSIDPDVVDKFHSLFAFDEREALLGCELWFSNVSPSAFDCAFKDFSGYIYRLLPVYGRIYVSTNYFCFRSSGPLTTKTWVSYSHD